MGVQGLWEIINQAGHSRSLANLAVIDGFERNHSQKRALRVGIDASIWYHHAHFNKGGENPELRLLFFRLRSLAELPLLPLFVFDCHERPKVKRGSKLGKSGSHALTDGLKKLLDIFGMEWRMALGEAEAELAYLNRTGVLDAVMTDDVDALVFGALRVIKNPSLTLSGNKTNPALNAAGKASKHHVMIYTAEAIRTHPDVQMSRGGLILFALLLKGDYGQGVKDIGKSTAHTLVRCGFGDELLEIFHRRGQENTRLALARWREAVNKELHTNSRKFLRHAYPSLSLPDNFPDMKLLENYADPLCSARPGRQGGGLMRDVGDLNLARAAAFCEEYFVEWGYKSAIIKRFRDLMWGAATMRVLRRAALEVDEKERTKRLERGQDGVIKGLVVSHPTDAVDTPISLVRKCLDVTTLDRRREAFVNSAQTNIGTAGTRGLISKIVGSRKHLSTDAMLEYRVELCPSQLVQIAISGLKGIRAEPPSHAGEDIGEDGPGQKLPPDPTSRLRMWIPGSIMKQVHPDLVAEFEASSEAKAWKTQNRKEKRKAPAAAAEDASGSVPPAYPVASSQGQIRSRPLIAEPFNQSIGASVRNGAALPGSSQWSFQDPISRVGFLFSAPNPDDPDVLELDYLSSSEHEAPTAAFDPFERLFNQVMGFDQSTGSNSTRHSRNRSATTPHTMTTYDNDHTITRPAKKQKTRHSLAHECRRAAGPSRIQELPVSDPNVIELSDSEEEIHFSTLSESKRYTNALGPKQPRANMLNKVPLYPLGLSLQESNLNDSMDEVIIDLT